MSRGGWIALLGVGVFVATLAILWIVFVSAPSPKEVCAHLTKLTMEAAGERGSGSAQGAIERLEARCIDDKDRRMRLRGRISYAKYARCITEAKDLAAAEHC